MTFFGWLTKPQLMVSFLDRLIMVTELSVLLFISVYCWYMVEQIKKSRKNKK